MTQDHAQAPPSESAYQLGSASAEFDAARATLTMIEPRYGGDGTITLPPLSKPRRGGLLQEPPRHWPAQPGAPDAMSSALRDVATRERIYRWMLALADALAAAIAVLIAIDGAGTRQLRLLYLLVVPLIVLGSKMAGLYDKDELVVDHSTLNELPRLMSLATTFALVAWLLRHYLVLGEAGTLHLLWLWALLSAGLVIARASARRIAGAIVPAERCMLVGRHELVARLEQRFARFPGVTLVSDVDSKVVASNHALLHELIERDRIHRVIVDTDATSPATTLDLVRLANATGLQVSLLPSLLGAVGSSVVFDDIGGGMVLMGVPRFGLSRSSMMLKRIFDLIGSGAVLLLAGPLMALIAIAIKLDSRGPVFFRQMRMGRNETPFQILKFRTMVDGADAMKEALREHNEIDGGLFKIESDPRITRIGGFLRRSGLDELPQVFNVLAGSMSLVGPRPLVIDEDRHVKGFDRRRLQLTPGITGRWQTLGAARVPLSEMVKIDYLYISNWSVWLDFKIIVETIDYLLRRRGL